MRTPWVLRFWLCLLLFLLVGCLGPNFPNENTDSIGDLRLRLRVDKTQVEVGTPIQIRFTVTNLGDETEVIELADRAVMDLWVSFQSQVSQERIRVSWSGGKDIEELRRMIWQPGETKTLEMTWIVDPLARNRLVNVAGILRFGEREVETTGTGVTICVERCRPG